MSLLAGHIDLNEVSGPKQAGFQKARAKRVDSGFKFDSAVIAHVVVEGFWGRDGVIVRILLLRIWQSSESAQKSLPWRGMALSGRSRGADACDCPAWLELLQARKSPEGQGLKHVRRWSDQ